MDQKFFKTSLITVVIALILFLLSAWLRYDRFEPRSLNRWGFGSDSAQYWDLSGNLMAGRGFVDSPGLGYQGMFITNTEYTPDLIRLPGYPAALALGRRFCDSVSLAYLLNFLFFLGTLFYGNLLLRSLFHFSERARVVWTLIFGLSPLFMVYGQGVQNDTMTCALVTGFTYHALEMIKTAKRKDLGAHLLAAVLFGAFALVTKVNSLFYIFPLLVLFSLFAAKRNEWRRCAVTLIFLLCTLLGWSARTYLITGSFRPAIYTGQNLFINFVFFQPNLAAPIQAWGGPARAEFCAAEIKRGVSAERVAVELDQKLTSLALEYCRSSPWRCAGIALRRVSGLFLSSYFEIADVVFAKFYGLQLVDNHVLDHTVLKDRTVIGYVFYRVLDFIHQAFKWLLLLSTVAVSITGLRKLSSRSDEAVIGTLGISSLTFVVGTGLLATVDRLALPVYAILFLCLVKCLFELRRKFL